MMRQYELVELVQAYNPNADEALLNKAYVYAMQKHGSQRRASGDPYFAHPLEVAAILTKLHLDDATIAVALLHDTIEDTDATRAEIDQVFGQEIGAIVDGLTKIDRLNLGSREEAQAENLRKLLLAIAEDVRVLLVKLADRLHNMRTLEFVPEHKKRRIAQETMEIYAPLAGRMGMQDMRSELEDLSFQTLHPEQYQVIRNHLDAYAKDNRAVVDEIRMELAQRFVDAGIIADVTSRLKAPFSVFKKMERKSISLEQLSDIIGFRVIVDSVDLCYKTLGVVHQTWSVVPGRFKDYISTPKQNDYRSIHTTIVGPERERVELQIRTSEMNSIAEMGIAAHALYKDEISGDMKRLEHESRAYAWLRNTIKHLTEGENPQEFLEHTKLELFQDQVFCFTPRGRLIALPRGATPIDFAFAVHTDIGNSCVSCRINGTAMPLTTKLRNGDEVQIDRDENHRPPPNWENIAVTGKARAAIRRSLRLAAQERAERLGKQIYDALLEREAFSVNRKEQDELLKRLKMRSIRSLYVALGEAQLSGEDLVHELDELKGYERTRKRKPLGLPVGASKDGWFSLAQGENFKFRIPGGQTVDADILGGAHLEFGTPVKVSAEGVLPGDRMVGILPENGILTIYPIGSEALLEYQDKDALWVDVLWDLDAERHQNFPVVMVVQSVNKPGILGQISSSIASCDANIVNLFFRTVRSDFSDMLFCIEVQDIAQFNDVTTTLKRIVGISNVRRATCEEGELIDNLTQQYKQLETKVN
ncbi:guanosine-3',5'-bis(diphosphate) 3'-pyrophosphohydrolase [Maritalea mobilis]|uniref:GTP pyrophosphokinase rsh n=1 Tax=Maritalea mobilis TaxID=483324 RepID=A0A4R6VRS8_9HYPH|nr:bifunctional (p)ppGpp synthetase/guanosine-3',5'-bis(diphosphate) 3'-pyrophosphohydrolase [Maritalea mobilis]TDQ66121.1 guanosine-3',5'-bis(diphosphate) 3'-pyrophosphohydrolase [Maritalea mobilis]